jgi:beta-phosphoglucomutase
LPDKPFEVSLHPALKAVIFDLDGVITDTAEYHYQAWKHLSNELGIPFDRKFNECLKGIDRMKSLELILERGNIKLSESKKTELAIQKNQHYQKLIAMVTPENILPGISNFLKELKNSGIKTAIASVSKNAMTVLKSLGIKDQFDFIVDAADIIKGKPDPEIFFRATEGLKILPRDCAGIEDSSAGIESIKQAGIYSIGVGSGSGNPHWKIKDTATLTLDALKTRFYKFFACSPQEVC